MEKLSCFKAYDIRGEIDVNLNEDVVYKIGRAFSQWLQAETVAIGGDARSTSEIYKQALAKGLQDGGTDVIDLGLTGTEEIYFATSHLKLDGGIQITASHNPINYNGLKLVREQAKPISGDSGLNEIKDIILNEAWEEPKKHGKLTKLSNRQAYIEHLFTYIDTDLIKPLKLVVNAGNGAAGPTVDALESEFQKRNMPIELIKVHNEPDPSFPNGIPNPMLIENQASTRDAIIEHNADFGVAWDGDFDRCFFFDSDGKFVDGYYIVGLLASAFLKKNQNESIIHDPRLVWNTQSLVQEYGGKAIETKTGHAFIKERMRLENAIYGGEMSAHHYFRDFSYCDSGMIPFLLMCELVSRTDTSLADLVKKQIELYPVSGEINIVVKDTQQVIQAIEDKYKNAAISTNYIDGLSIDLDEWRFNLRGSNTEPVLRLNVETKANPQLLKQVTDELVNQINAFK